MANEPLPTFKYHPDPVATGSVDASSTICVCCGKARGFIYTGPVYATEEYDRTICPWCIADGSAREKFDATFTDEDGIGGSGEWDEVGEEVIEEVAYRTPGFTGWQQEQWWTHCEDAGQYLGPAGHAELTAAGADAITAIRESGGHEPGEEWDEIFSAMDQKSGPTAYLFKCVKCGKLGGYWDGH